MTIRGREIWGPVLMMGLLQSVLVACLPWLIERTGVSAGGWSLILSVGMVPVLVGAPGWGRLVDRSGARRVSVLASAMVLIGFGMVLSVLAMGLQAGLAMGLLLVARLAHGIGAGGVFPAAQRLAVADAEPQHWGYRLARLQIAVHVGRLAGPALVMLIAWAGMMPVLLLAGVLALLGVVNIRRSREGRQREGCAGAAVPLARLSWGAGWPFYLMALLLTTWIGTLQFVLGPWLTRVADVPSEIGASLTATALVLSSLVGLLSGPIVHGRVRSPFWVVVLWGGALLAGGTMLVRAASVPAIYSGVALLAFGAAILTPWYGARLRQCHPQSQGEIAGRLTSTHTLGYIIGTLAGGWSLEMGPDSPMAVSAMFAPMLVLLAGYAQRATGKDRISG